MKRIYEFCFLVLLITNLTYSVDVSFLDTADKNWMNSINNGLRGIDRQYVKKAVIFMENGSFIQGQDLIKNYYKNMVHPFVKIRSISALYRLEISPDYLYYEIGKLTAESNESYRYFTIYRQEKDKWLREMEIVLQTSDTTTNSKMIDQARNKWLELYRGYNPQKMAESIYLKNAIFYHNGFIDTNINETYIAKASRNFVLTLSTKSIFFIKSDLVFEVGEYGNSYSGTYAFIWKKQPSGDWKILLDVNRISLN